MKFSKIPSRSTAASTVLVGRRRQGNWAAREQNGLFGGLFVNRAQAFKYVLQNGHHLQGIVEVAQDIELDVFVHAQVATTSDAT